MTSGVAIKTCEEIFQIGKVQPRYQNPSFHARNFNSQYDTKTVNCPDKAKGSFNPEDAQNLLRGESNFNQTGGCSETMHTEREMHSYEQVSLRFLVL